jgi:hypothetical protein
VAPPFAGFAVKVTLVPAQIVVAEAVTLTLGVKEVLTVILKVPEQPLAV